jgi:hypothetical protein
MAGALPTLVGMKTLMIAAAVIVLAGCAKRERGPNRVERLSGKTLTETIQENRGRLLSIPGVIDVQAGDCGTDSCIKVFVEKKTEMLTSELPLMLETWRVDIVERPDAGAP